MIQRIQSLWFSMAALLLGALYFLPLVSATIASSSVRVVMKAGNVSESSDNQLLHHYSFWWINAALMVVILFVLVLIFLYANRKLQIQLAYVAILLTLLLCFIFSQAIRHVFKMIDLTSANYHFAVLLPSFAVFFLILAIKAIKKDEKLIQMADRMR